MQMFWRKYYGPERINRAQHFGRVIAESSCGNLSSFYNDRGEQIRGWYRKSERRTELNPLIVKYSK